MVGRRFVKSKNYKKLKVKYPNIADERKPVTWFIGGISRSVGQALKLSRNSQKQKNCPCPSSSSTFAFQCPSYRALHLSGKIIFNKKKLCSNYFISHFLLRNESSSGRRLRLIKVGVASVQPFSPLLS